MDISKPQTFGEVAKYFLEHKDKRSHFTAESLIRDQFVADGIIIPSNEGDKVAEGYEHFFGTRIESWFDMTSETNVTTRQLVITIDGFCYLAGKDREYAELYERSRCNEASGVQGNESIQGDTPIE